MADFAEQPTPEKKPSRRRPRKKPNSTNTQHPPEVLKETEEPPAKKKKAYMTLERFDSLTCVNPLTSAAIREVLRYETMTKVQAMTLPVTCAGKDLVAKAKTGTGKTIAFMVPCVDRASRQRRTISALVVSPTRELAQQTFAEGKVLASKHGEKNVELACVVGGTAMKKDYAALQTCNVLIATPGRLVDHMENTAGMADRFAALQNLVFDECDQLLDAGFRPAIETILSFLKPSYDSRQTLLFSATLPADVNSIAKSAMRRGYDVINCNDADDDDPTHADVPQRFVVCPDVAAHSDELAATLAAVVASHHKVIVFFQTARQTQLYFELLTLAQTQASPVSSALSRTTFLEMHSRKSQPQREKCAKIFRDADTGYCLFTSDVSARGMDYPDVTLVIQFGAPADSAQYVHRLGRTARGDGARGEGLLLLCDYERYFLNDLKALPIQPKANTPGGDSVRQTLVDAARQLPDNTRVAAYQAYVGYLNSNLRKLRWSKDDLVDRAGQWCLQITQASEVPKLQAKTIGKMGLKGFLVPDRSTDNGRGGGGRGGGPPPSSSSRGRAGGRGGGRGVSGRGRSGRGGSGRGGGGF